MKPLQTFGLFVPLAAYTPRRRFLSSYLLISSMDGGSKHDDRSAYQRHFDVAYKPCLRHSGALFLSHWAHRSAKTNDSPAPCGLSVERHLPATGDNLVTLLQQPSDSGGGIDLARNREAVSA
jgi:hypothetical protein